MSVAATPQVELAGLVDGESGTVIFDAEIPEAGSGGSATVVADQELVFDATELEPCAWIIGEPGGPGGEVEHGRNDVAGAGHRF